jgi:hypothetical protein
MGFHLDEAKVVSYSPLLAALLALVVLVRFPNGLGGALWPIRRWLAGGPFRVRARRRLPRSAVSPPVDVAGPPGGAEQAAGEPPLPGVPEPALAGTDPAPSGNPHAPAAPLPSRAAKRGMRVFKRRSGR